MNVNNFFNNKANTEDIDKEIIFDEFWKTVIKVVEKAINEFVTKHGIEASSYAIVSGIGKCEYSTDEEPVLLSVKRADVRLANGDVIHDLYNATGQILSIGDKVKIYGSISNLSNRYIGIKYEGNYTDN